jgi:hypothetical protein
VFSDLPVDGLRQSDLGSSLSNRRLKKSPSGSSGDTMHIKSTESNTNDFVTVDR